jgi:hypothetical protein
VGVVVGNIVVRVLWRKISMSDNKEKDVDKSNQDGNIDYVDIPVEQQQFTFTYTISEDL